MTEKVNLTADDLIAQCSIQLEYYLTNLTESEKKFVKCQHCKLNESELDILLSSDKCLPRDFSAYFPLVFILYGSVLLVAVPGNSLVVYTVCKFKQIHSMAHFFFANMAIGDLLMSILCIPFSVVSIIFLQYWPFGRILCVTVNYLQAVSVFVSSYTIVAISVDRYIAIMYPLKARLTYNQTKIIIASVWLLATITTIPVAVFSKLVIPEERIYQDGNLTVCLEQWPTNLWSRIYTMALALLQYFFPVSVLIFTCSRIGWKVWGSSSSGSIQLSRKGSKSSKCSLGVDGEGGLNRRFPIVHSPAKMIRLTLVVVCVYSICWLPFNILQVIRDCWPSINHWSHTHLVWFLCHWLAMSHTCYNPIILGWMNVKFRSCFVKALKDILAFWCCCCKKCVGRRRDAYDDHANFSRGRHSSSTAMTELPSSTKFKFTGRRAPFQKSGSPSAPYLSAPENAPVSTHSFMAEQLEKDEMVFTFQLSPQRGREGRLQTATFPN